MSFWDFTRGPARTRMLFDYGCWLGFSTADILGGSGLSPEQLADPNAALFAEQELQVIRNLLKLTGAPPQLGVELGLRYHFSAYGVWGFGLISSATMRDALQLALRFLPLTFAFTMIAYHEENDLGVITFGEPDLERELTRFLVEGDMAAATTLLAEVAGPDFRIERMTFKAEPVRGHKVRSVLGAPLHYAAPSNSVAFRLEYLDRRLPHANPTTAAQCEQMCADLIARRRARSDLSTIVQQYLNVPGRPPPDLAAMARVVNVSERTLKRRLKDEGTSFRMLLEESRRASAEVLLKEQRLSIADIAAQLGFSDASTFSQAFKRWHGVAPNVYRQAIAGALQAPP
ncbi:MULTISPECIES: AraC family transcriptional regulator [Paraburkholderia]|uniref:AraC family transcriptional regulator n=1 Tax=Paraburkholderia TaxID=1822464 RepID=UPI00225521B4|nr:MULTISPECIES: AraC family transcriptional regulator [Paraburkholderia]MCX4161819.1 AraC family transcriptional regulator [Paraburkholderia megapolitana]MDN7157316.1 AraC family transcriptional regulator [Paraburkholderia sp. CHISQ3]MDQ6494361.1 AraC family transcriptional regulator [Paraburkholderia megapolitana]